MMSTVRNAVVYLSKGGSTRRVAEQISEQLPGTSWLFELAQFENEDPTDFDHLFLGSPTYGLGELDYRWLKYLRSFDFAAVKKSATRVALFVLGDQKWHGKTFAGSLVEFSKPFHEAGISLGGHWSADGYHFEAAPAVDANGNFPGLVIDEVTQSELTSQRIEQWIKLLTEEVACPASADQTA